MINNFDARKIRAEQLRTLNEQNLVAEVEEKARLKELEIFASLPPDEKARITKERSLQAKREHAARQPTVDPTPDRQIGSIQLGKVPGLENKAITKMANKRYTKQELEERTKDELRAIAAANNIRLPANAKKAAYVKAILALK